MKKFLYLFLAVFLVSCGSDNTADISSGTSDGGASFKISAASILSQMDKANYRDGEVLVKFKSGTVSTSSVKAHQAVGAQVVKKYKLVKNLEKVELPAGVSVKEAVQSYLADPNVEYAEPNYIRKTMAAIPIDKPDGIVVQAIDDEHGVLIQDGLKLRAGAFRHARREGNRTFADAVDRDPIRQTL